MTRQHDGDADLTDAIDQARRGDEHAFRLIYRLVQPQLLRYARALVGADAEDVAAEAWAQIARDIGRFAGDGDAFRGWSATIVRHRAMDLIRAQRRRPVQSFTAEDLADVFAANDTEEAAIDNVSTNAAIAMIATLPPDQAEAVMLRVVVGLSAEAAAQVLGKRAGAVRTAAHRGLRRLAEQLTEPTEPRPTGHRRAPRQYGGGAS